MVCQLHKRLFDQKLRNVNDTMWNNFCGNSWNILEDRHYFRAVIYEVSSRSRPEVATTIGSMTVV